MSNPLNYGTVEFGMTVLLNDIDWDQFIEALQAAGFRTEPVVEDWHVDDDGLLLVTKHHLGGEDSENELIDEVRVIIDSCGGDPDATSAECGSLGAGDLAQIRSMVRNTMN
jgi:hypothetical protein